MMDTRKRLLLSLAAAVICLSFSGLQLWTERQIISGKGSISGNVGQLYFATDATAGQNLYMCTAVTPAALPWRATIVRSF
jgi:hypothetical protein